MTWRQLFITVTLAAPWFAALRVGAFAPPPSTAIRASGATSFLPGDLLMRKPSSGRIPNLSSTGSSQLFLAGNNGDQNKPSYDMNADMGGQSRGVPLGLLVLAIVVWSFSIPPEFRRAHFCTSDRCVANRSRCYDCVTVGEWTQDVKDYYANGGGIQWDFSVDPESPFLLENMKKK